MFGSVIRRITEDIVLSITFTTRIPLPCCWIRKDRTLAEAVWAIPLGGALIGALTGGLMFITLKIGFDAALSSVIAIIAMTLATGALHEDGLADFCDGIGGGHSIQQRLKIMQDSRIGVYGGLALILTFFLLASLIEQLWYALGAWHFFIAIVAAKTISLSSSALIFMILKPARDVGQAIRFGRPGHLNLILMFIWPMCTAILILGIHAVALICGAFVTTLAISLIAYTYLRGYTGDVLGAGIHLSFIGSLTALKVILT
ncbi:MAG: Adenosylcobinamide-GDP ribazoletransferase [Hyphomicrobiaceae bacterium hypho_1]